MPEVFNLFGFTYFFFSREHLPIHVHIEGAEGYAVYDLDGEQRCYCEILETLL